MKTILLTCFTFIIFCQSSESQHWISTQGPGFADFRDVEEVGDEWWAATSAGIYTSTDQGANWEVLKTIPQSLVIVEILVEQDEILIFGYQNIGRVGAYVAYFYRSTDRGGSWTNNVADFSGYDASRDVRLLRIKDVLYFSNNSYLYKSENDGVDWVEVNTPTSPWGFTGQGNHLMYYSFDSTYISDDEGETWRGIAELSRVRMFIRDSVIILFNNQASVRSSDLGTSWEDIDFALPQENYFYGTSDDRIYSIGYFKYYSEDSGATWDLLTNDFAHANGMTELQNGDLLFRYYKQIYKLDKQGNQITIEPSGFYNAYVSLIDTLPDGRIICQTESNTFFIKEKNTNDWSKIDIPSNSWLWSHYVDDGDTSIIIQNEKIILSTNGFDDYEIIDSEIRSTSLWNPSSVIYYNGKIYYYHFIELVVSDDFGKTRKKLEKETGVFFNNPRSNMLVADDDFYLADDDGRVYKSTDEGETWNAVFEFQQRGAFPAGLFELSGRIVLHEFDKTFYQSVDNGINWEKIEVTQYPTSPSGFRYNLIDIVSISNVWYGTFDGAGVYRSEDFGVSWQVMNSGLANKQVNGLLVSDQQLFLGTKTTSVWSNDLMTTSVSVPLTVDNQIKISPNPGRDFFQIELTGFRDQQNNPSSGTVQIFDQQGRSIFSQQINIHEGVIDLKLTNVASGIYSVVVTKEAEYFVGQLVKLD